MIDITNIFITAFILFILGLVTTYLWGFDLPKIITTIIYFIIIALWGYFFISHPMKTTDNLIEGMNRLVDFLINFILPMALGEAFGDALASIVKGRYN